MGRKLLFVGAILLTAVALRAGPGLWLTWTCGEPMPVPDVVFVILSSTNAGPLGQFRVWTNVAAPPVWIMPKAKEFFLCYSSNTVTHVVSPLNVRTP